ncbi:RagB/SusD family nutrient uptake outer membrane protein [Gramella sp. AN32]|uniref:RagB/SusD family nutrient uptake outer membrane protein n=1 Tax=Christiangramia antarctica TaxID=2058158 RepID=A0ABW5XAP1_9FLAO|nr:RagB/SusD family nutrient uptake outer membrane protein [Gramella sp. AN32]MCM4157566.1 RagB/SusD family nutrient uptake outer membrane protein [Gramella sp. AN32]
MNTIQLHSSKVLLGILLLLLSTSCSDFLEEDPENLVATSNYYTTEQDAIAAVNSIYAYLGSYDASRGNTAGVYHSTFWITQGLASDEMLNNQLGTPQYDQLATFSYNADNAALLEIWQIHYKTIYLANVAIDRIPSIDMDPAVQNRLINEAKFLRGLLYFNMVRMFGEIPLVISEDAPLNPEAASVSAIYDQIIADLTAAESLPADGEIQQGRATTGAAKGILAKVYLRMGEFQLAADKAKEVIDSGQYDLWDDFSEAFEISSRGGKEAVFSVGFGDGGGAISFWEVGQFNVRLLPTELSREVDGVSNTQGWQIALPDLYDSYEDIDERKEATFMTNFMASDGTTVNLDKIYIDKYWDREADPTAGGSFNDFPVLRYSDVLLVYAEAQASLNNFSEANEYLNMVRERAGLDDVDVSDMGGFIDVLLNERRREFVAEGMRWFDLTRLGSLEEAVQEAKNINVGSEYYLFPIPQRERDVNPNLPQNQGF